MNGFVNAIAKFSIIIIAIFVALLIALIGMIVFAPSVLMMILKFCLLAAGIVVAVYLLLGVASAICLLIFLKQYSKSGKVLCYQM